MVMTEEELEDRKSSVLEQMWDELCDESQRFSEDFLRKHSNKLNWCNVAHYQKFSYEFFNDFRNELESFVTLIVARNNAIDNDVVEKILLEYWDKDDELTAKDLKYYFYYYTAWESISLHPLSEHALEIVKDRVNWNFIYYEAAMDGYNRLSEKFLLKYKDRIDFSLPYVKNALEKRKEKGFSV